MTRFRYAVQFQDHDQQLALLGQTNGVSTAWDIACMAFKQLDTLVTHYATVHMRRRRVEDPVIAVYDNTLPSDESQIYWMGFSQLAAPDELGRIDR